MLTEPTHQVARVFSHLFSRQVKVGKALKDLAAAHPNAIYIPLSSENSFASYDNWDWSRVKFRMVLSMAGSHSGDLNVNRVGLTGLSAQLRAEGWVPGVKEKVVAEFQVSVAKRALPCVCPLECPHHSPPQ
jgi:tyrosyl-DNA phosphodiesterase 1